MRYRMVATGVAVGVLAVVQSPTVAGATHGGGDNASCVAYFVTGISPGERGPFLSETGAQNPFFHPFGANVVSTQARSDPGACPFQPPPL